MSQTSSFAEGVGARAYAEKRMAMHNKFIHNTVPGVDAAPPQHALDMMALRHKRPNMGDGSWLMQQTVKVWSPFPQTQPHPAPRHV